MGRLFKKWVLRFRWLLGVAIFTVGISGIPGDLDQWYIWIATVVENPTVQKWAEFAAETAQHINEPTVRFLLGAIGLIAIAWPMKRFLRLRYKIRIWGKSKMSDQVWVPKQDALDAIKYSDWGQMKEPYLSERRSIVDVSAFLGALHHEHTISGIPPKKKAAKRFQIYVEATLRSFHESNPKAFRQNEDGIEETEINALKTFLSAVLDRQISEEFGDIPSIKVI